MKRAVSSFWPEWSRAAWLLMLLASPAMAQQNSARFVIIDARDGLTPEVLEAYDVALGADERVPLVKRRVRIITSNRHGFNAGPVSIPSHVREVDVDVTVMVRGGQPLISPISVNRLTVSRRAPTRVVQSTEVIGR